MRVRQSRMDNQWKKVIKAREEKKGWRKSDEKIGEGKGEGEKGGGVRWEGMDR